MELDFRLKDFDYFFPKNGYNFKLKMVE